MAKAQEIAAIAQMDLLRDELDLSLEKYNPLGLEKTIEKIKPDLPGLLELCEKYFEEKIKPIKAPGTQTNYRNYLGAIKQCSSYQIIKDAVKIKDFIRQVRSAGKTREALTFIYKVVQWAKLNELIPKSTENPYKELAEDITGKSTYQKPKHIQELLKGEYDEYYRAYSPHEATAIIEELADRGCPKGVYRDLVNFLFLTGCRTGEAIGLRWEDIVDDCSKITFRHSLCFHSKDIKGLKTERYGNTSRKFPCGERLKQLLLKLRNAQTEAPSGKTFVFNRNGEVINYGSFHDIWNGCKEGNQGVIKHLIKEKKLKTYLKPYSTRHSFITWQLKAGQTPANVAKFVGNTPETIYKHYVSADEDAKVMFEI